MIRRSNEMQNESIAGLKDGNGTVHLVNILNLEDFQGKGRLFALNIIPPGCSIGKHTHKGDFETYYILKGTAEINDNGVCAVLNPGDVTMCADGEYHAIRNIGTEDLEYIAVILYSKKG